MQLLVGNTVYVTSLEPVTNAGLNVFPTTPCPDQVPPGVPVTKLFKLITGFVLQTGVGLVQLAEKVVTGAVHPEFE
jgi:hypothetical protein